MDFTTLLSNRKPEEILLIVIGWAIFALISSNVKAITTNSANFTQAMVLAGTQTTALNKSNETIIELQRRNTELNQMIETLQDTVRNLSMENGKAERARRELADRLEFVELRNNELRVDLERKSNENNDLLRRIRDLETQVGLIQTDVDKLNNSGQN